MTEFASDEHIESLSHEKLKDLARYLAKSRNDLNKIIEMKNRKIGELQRKIDNQRRQLAGMQNAIIRLKGGGLTSTASNCGRKLD